MAFILEKCSSLEAALGTVSIASHDAGSDSGYSDSPGDQHESIDKKFLSEQSWVHNAGDMLYRLRGLYITCENYESLLQCFSSDLEARLFTTRVIEVLYFKPLLLSGEEALKTLEESWSGKPEPNISGNTSSSPIFAQIHISYYLSAQGKVIKELSYLAVSQDSLDLLFKYDGRSKYLSTLSKPHAITSNSNIPPLCERILQRSVPDDLSSAVEKSVFSVRADPVIGMLYCKNWVDEMHGIVLKPTTDLVNDVYKMVKIGRREPTDSFIRSSEFQITRPLPVEPLTGFGGAIDVIYDSGTTDFRMFLTRNIPSEIRKSEIGHALADCLKKRHFGKRIQFHWQTQLPKDKVNQVFQIADSSDSPPSHAKHNPEVCRKCKIMDFLL
ncbi:hypothetical protein V2W45_1360539 [Cenococcum geophilum]